MNRIIKKSSKVFNWLKSRITNHALILGYHRITKARNDPYLMNVSPENFAEHLEVIRKLGEPVSLENLVNKIKANDLNKKYIAITFDDGYSDNFYWAKPILEKYDVPATVFVSSGKLNSEFWWDELERLVLSASITPEELHINYKGGSVFWKHNEIDNRTPDMSLFSDLYNHLYNLEEDQVREVLCGLKDLTDAKLIEPNRYRTMTGHELALLVSSHLIQTGSHSHTHRNLRFADHHQQITEIQESKQVLEEITGKHIIAFSYPHGSVAIDAETILKENGYHFACGSYPNYTFRNTNIFLLPRFWTPDINGEKFAKWLSGWKN